MIIYGTRAAHLKSTQPRSIVCAHCGQADATVLSVYGKYAHIFWIPVFPIGRVGLSQCSHCKQTLEYKNMNRDLQQAYNNLRAETRVPIWQFAGLGLVGVLIVFGVYSSSHDKKNRLEYVANPIAGDVYKYKTDDNNYSTLKVISVSADSVFVSPNKYQTDKMTGIYKIDKAENYPGESYGIARSDVKQMLQNDDIYDIDRN